MLRVLQVDQEDKEIIKPHKSQSISFQENMFKRKEVQNNVIESYEQNHLDAWIV